MEERTQTDKIIGASITVTLGGAEYNIRPLPVRPNREWLRKYRRMIEENGARAGIKFDAENYSEFSAAMADIMTGGDFDRIADLFFEYAQDLPREQIEESASSIEVLNAFSELLLLANPMLAMTAASELAKQSAKS